MKKTFISVGLAALGVGGVSAFAQTFSGLDPYKPWSVALTLRGYYDDNINTVSKGKQDSFGFEVSPSVGLHLTSEQTTFDARYMYTAHYSDIVPGNATDHFDHNHAFDLQLKHTFSPRYSLSIGDSFVIGQEPDVLRAGDILGSFQRISGNNIRNYGTINFDAQFTRLFGIQVGYANAFYDYQNSGAQFTSVGVIASHSGISDRLEHTAHFDTHWQLLPQTVFVVGYQYSETDFTANEAIQAIVSGGPYYKSGVRDNRSHYGYVGINQTFTPELTGSVRVGATYSDSFNDPMGATSWSPYAQLSLTYNYLPGCGVALGFTHDRSANDSVASTGNYFIHDSETSVVFASVHHRITPKLLGTVMGSFQQSTFNAPHQTSVNGKNERFYMANLDLEYQFTHHFSVHSGYNFDYLNSEMSGNYARNRVYIGATFGY
jgi:hypothetical protein